MKRVILESRYLFNLIEKETLFEFDNDRIFKYFVNKHTRTRNWNQERLIFFEQVFTVLSPDGVTEEVRLKIKRKFPVKL